MASKPYNRLPQTNRIACATCKHSTYFRPGEKTPECTWCVILGKIPAKTEPRSGDRMLHKRKTGRLKNRANT